MGLRFFFRGNLHLASFALAATVVASSSLAIVDQLILVAFSLTFFSVAALNALGFAGLAAWASDAEGEAIGQLRRGLAGPFVSPRHSPYLYFPAFAYGITTFGVSLAMEGMDALLSKTALAISPLWLIITPCVLAVIFLILGSRAYARTGLKAIARVAEEARTIYGGKPAPVDPPYGWRLAKLLPGAAATYFKKELREQSRIHRGLWAYSVLVGLAFLLYGLDFGSVLNAIPWIAVVLLAWISTLPTRRKPRHSGEQILLTLPQKPWARLVGRWLALLFVAAHLGLATVFALFIRHEPMQAWILLAILPVSTLWAVALTMRRSFGRLGGSGLGSGGGFGAAASWLTPMVATGGIAATIWQLPGLITLGILSLVAVGIGMRTSQIGESR
jgi:hypothetical protein